MKLCAISSSVDRRTSTSGEIKLLPGAAMPLPVLMDFDVLRPHMLLDAVMRYRQVPDGAR